MLQDITVTDTVKVSATDFLLKNQPKLHRNIHTIHGKHAKRCLNTMLNI